MGNAKALAALVPLVALATIANAHSVAPLEGASLMDAEAAAALRRATIEQNHGVALDEAIKATHLVPAGFLLVGRGVDGSFVVDVVPEGEVVTFPSGTTPGTIECHNDVLSTRDYSYHSKFPLAANMLAPAVQNMASQGMCDEGGPHDGAITLLQFRTLGDTGGSLFIQGSSAFESGFFAVDCYPAGTGIGFGVSDKWLTTLEVDDAQCDVWEHGADPSEYVWFSGTVYNGNVASGTTYVSVN